MAYKGLVNFFRLKSAELFMEDLEIDNASESRICCVRHSKNASDREDKLPAKATDSRSSSGAKEPAPLGVQRILIRSTGIERWLRLRTSKRLQDALNIAGKILPGWQSRNAANPNRGRRVINLLNGNTAPSLNLRFVAKPSFTRPAIIQTTTQTDNNTNRKDPPLLAQGRVFSA